MRAPRPVTAGGKLGNDRPPGAVLVVGDVNGDGKMEIIACSNINNNGTIAPGNQPGTMYIYDGNYQVIDTIPNAWASNMILLQDVENIGKKYEVKDVKSGHARNFLIPQA
jgi:hypothetical protein